MKLIAIILIAAAVIWVIASALIFLLPYVLIGIGIIFVAGAFQRLIEPKKID